jgi:hypothetical protein
MARLDTRVGCKQPRCQAARLFRMHARIVTERQTIAAGLSGLCQFKTRG